MVGVPVTKTALTFVGSQTVRIVPATATSLPRCITGSVTPAMATVRALQPFTGGFERQARSKIAAILSPMHMDTSA